MSSSVCRKPFTHTDQQHPTIVLYVYAQCVYIYRPTSCLHNKKYVPKKDVGKALCVRFAKNKTPKEVDFSNDHDIIFTLRKSSWARVTCVYFVFHYVRIIKLPTSGFSLKKKKNTHFYKSVNT